MVIATETKPEKKRQPIVEIGLMSFLKHSLQTKFKTIGVLGKCTTTESRRYF